MAAIKVKTNLVSKNILDYSNEKRDEAKNKVQEILRKQVNFNEWLGWVDYHKTKMAADYSDLQKFKSNLSVFYDCVVVVGIGGSYLGTRCLDEVCHSSAVETLPVVYAGHHLCAQSHLELLETLKDKQPLVVVISKSGTTTEPGVAFRILRSYLDQKYGDLANQRIIAVTDENEGALIGQAREENWKSFVIPSNIGGRYSVFTPVGMVPLSLAGYDLDEFKKGVLDFYQNFDQQFMDEVVRYATIRYAAYQQGKKIEILSVSTPKAAYLAEWWKQLFGESEGKEGKGLFPASVTTTTDLHSMGQYLQQGPRHILETFLTFSQCSGSSLKVPNIKDSKDNLDYLVEHEMEYINKVATQATMEAHSKGEVECIEVSVSDRNPYTTAQLLCFFKVSCALSAYLINVNPFDQPGVEDYKVQMFKMLKKPGY